MVKCSLDETMDEEVEVDVELDNIDSRCGVKLPTGDRDSIDSSTAGLFLFCCN